MTKLNIVHQPSLDASLGELRVQQLQTGLTTLFGFNVLVTFDNVHYKTSGASAPVPTSTQERFVGLKCEECGKWCKSKAGLVAHHRVHDNDSVGTNMVAQLACADCSRLFPTKIGLSQHRRHAHPTQHNADKLSRVKHSGARWSQQESQSLLRLANNLYPSCETQTALFARLEQYFPGRSAISIKTRLRVLNWQAQQDESSSGGPDQTIGQIAAYSSEADDYSVWFKQTVDCAVSLLESHADSSLASVDLLAFARGLQSGIMTPEQVLSLLDLHASRTFPHTWKTVSRRRRQLAHRMPVNRKQIRRANYAAIQTLYHQRRKDAASAVLDGSWKDLYKGNCGLPPDAEQYWKQVLSAPKHVDSRPSRVIVPSDWSLIEPITGEEVGRTVRSMGNSSPGLDKLTPRMLRRFNANVDQLHPCRLSATIPMQRRVRMVKLLSTQCRVLRNVVNDSAFGKVVRDLSLPIRVHGSCVNTKEELVAAWGDSLHNSVDGRGLRELVASPLSNRWLVFPERVFSRIFIRGIQLRCNLLRTRVRSVRHGHGGQTILCRGNCGQPDSLVHILQSCWITHDARCARHNRVARELAKRLRRLGYTVFEELRAPTSTSFIKPDLIAVRERRATVIDVSIVSDGRGVTVWNEKKQKYGADEFSLAIISALRAIGCDVDFLVHQPMIISYRGICFPQSAKAVIGLGLSKVTVSDLCLLAIVGSLHVKIQMRPTCVGGVVVTRSPRMSDIRGSDVRGSDPGTATGNALLMSSNKNETRVQCFPLVWTHRNNYARIGGRPFKREWCEYEQNTYPAKPQNDIVCIFQINNVFVSGYLKTWTLNVFQRLSHSLNAYEIKWEWREWAPSTKTALHTEAFGELSVYSNTPGNRKIQRTYYVYKPSGIPCGAATVGWSVSRQNKQTDQFPLQRLLHRCCQMNRTETVSTGIQSEWKIFAKDSLKQKFGPPVNVLRDTNYPDKLLGKTWSQKLNKQVLQKVVYLSLPYREGIVNQLFM
ncbi:retrovirus-related Pol polyprotein from type-1 retrotransposable element R2 [Clonorchis sinensis]|uniref:Retrovirus-related Pol polyprotein from type-1 retrotransposable element R2 n=2 Tax=Clonorchis sinensis TaxID=79923 RepID=G7YBJ1_CLOSI|nr:retrovirus-related Pol polyprotein from type-1 retrotransposable element R2 [Clonorchis sinensis]